MNPSVVGKVTKRFLKKIRSFEIMYAKTSIFDSKFIFLRQIKIFCSGQHLNRKEIWCENNDD